MAHLIVQPDGGLNLGKLSAEPPPSTSEDEKAVQAQKPTSTAYLRQHRIAAVSPRSGKAVGLLLSIHGKTEAKEVVSIEGVVPAPGRYSQFC